MIPKLFSLGFLAVGIFLLVQIVLPLASYKIWEIQNIAPEAILASPVSDTKNVLGVSISTNGDDNFPVFISNLKRNTPAPYSSFALSVPKLNIHDAKVMVDTNDLSHYLGHLPGSALPGEKGNVFVSGHSALPIAFQGEKNYGAIFADLPQLKKGDEIDVSAGGDYTYQVVGMRVVNPKDLSVVYPADPEGRYITLMTCVPPGLNTHRLVVIGKMI